MRVLVTGGSGFLGQHVVTALRAAGHEVIAPSSRELNLVSPSACSGVNGGPIQYGYPVVGPLAWTDRSIDAIYFYLAQQEPDAVVHLAATVGGIGANKDNPGKFIYENLQMGLNVFEACRLANVKKVVNVATVCAYPKHTPVPFKEEDIWNGYPEETNAPYGIAKKTIMEMGIAYHKQYGMNITNLVPVNMAGEYDNFSPDSSHVIPAIITKFEHANYDPGIRCMCSCHRNHAIRHIVACCHNGYNKKPKVTITLWGTGSASREFLYASDCAKAIALSLEIDTGPQPINLGTGQEITIREVAEIIKRIGCYGAEILWDASKPDGQPRRSLDTSRAKTILGWEATTPLEETISRTIKWYRTNE